jgi:hypothetical protein
MLRPARHRPNRGGFGERKYGVRLMWRHLPAILPRHTESIEVVRARYRPKPILTLFVGESARNSGDFFYYGNTVLTGYMKKAMEAAGLGGAGDFLEHFKSYGWYLDDLILTPVNHLRRSQRKKKCRDAQASLAARIKEYQPRAIVSLLLSIRAIVEAAAIDAGSDARLFAVPFAGMGQQLRFLEKMAHILPQLPNRTPPP